MYARCSPQRINAHCIPIQCVHYSANSTERLPRRGITSPKIALIGPGYKFESGITHYTDWLEWHLSNPLLVIRIHDLLPKFLFPGRERCTDQTERGIDWWNPITWIRACWNIRHCDILLLEYWSAAANHMYLFISLFFLGNVILEMHEVIEPEEKRSKLLALYSTITRKLLMWRATAIVVHSRHDLELVNTNKATIIPHPIYPSILRPSETKPNDRFYILFFGLIRDYKGVQDLIDAFQMLDIPNKYLHIMGEVWDPITVPKQSNIRTQFQYVDASAIHMAFDRAHVIVLPYTRASQSGVAHVAMDYGIPIVATPVGGLIDALSGYAGWWPIEPNTPRDIANALQAVYTFRESEHSFAIPEHLKDEKIIAKWKDLFDMVTKK